MLRRYRLERPAGFSAALVSPRPAHLYTGMLTGYVAGEYALAELTFPLESLAAWAGVEFVQGSVVRVHPEDRAVSLADGRRLEYEAASFDVGSAAAGRDLPGIARHALAVKPLEEVVAIPRVLDATEAGTPRVVVVGGGASGVELALTIAGRLERQRRRGEILLVEEGERLLAEFTPGVGRAARRILDGRGVSLALGARIVAAEAETARGAGTAGSAGTEGTAGSAGIAWTAAGDAHPFDVLVWAAGPSAPRLFADSGLPTDPGGFLQVGPSLQALGRGELFGAGDCVSLATHPRLAKTGVYAVREGPVLWRALRAYLCGGTLPRYSPQRRALYALNTGEGRALLGRGAFRSHSRWARWLKDRIDRRFMRRYLGLLPADPSRP